MGETTTLPTLGLGHKTICSSENGNLNDPEPSPQRRLNNQFVCSTGTPSNNTHRKIVDSVDLLPDNTGLFEPNTQDDISYDDEDGDFCFSDDEEETISPESLYADKCHRANIQSQQRILDICKVAKREKILSKFKNLSRLKITLRPLPAPSEYASIKQRFLSAYDPLSAQAGLFDGISDARSTMSSINATLESIDDMMTRMKKAVKFEDGDDTLRSLFSRLETLLLLIMQLSRANSLVDMVLPVLAYIKSWMGSTTITELVCKWAEQILTEDSSGAALSEESVTFAPVEGDLDGQAGWFTANWTKLTQGHFGRRLASLINLLVIAGLAPETVTNKMTVELYKVVHVAAERKKNPSIFHHLFSTLDWLVDSVIPAVSTGNMALLLTDSDTDQVDTLYRTALDAARLATTGQMKRCTEKYGISTEADLLVHLTNTNLALLTLKKRVFDDAMMVRDINARLIMLDKVSADLQASWHDAGLRTKPYAVFIYGGSSLGKSVLANIACHSISRRNKFPEGPEYTCTINGSDKYQSDYNSKHICVIFDDMGNTRPERTEGNPLFVLIQFINNMHCSALSPEAEKKGKMDIRSRIVVVTSNTSDLHASYFSVNPASIMRRFDLFVEVKLKADSTGPDGGLHEKHCGNPMPDAWILGFGKFHIRRNTSEEHHDTINSLYIKKDASVMDLVDYFDKATPVFYAKQEAIVASSTDMHKKEHCKHHDLYTLPCPKCASAPILVDFKDPDKLDTQVGLFAGFGRGDPLNAKVKDNPYFEEILTDYSLSGYTTVPTVEECKRNFENYPEPFAHEAKPISYTDRLKLLLNKPVPQWAISIRQAKHNFKPTDTMLALGTISALGLVGFAVHKMMSPQPLDGQGAYITRIQAAAGAPRQIANRDDAFRRVYSNVAEASEASRSSTLGQLEAKIDRNLHIVTIQEFDELNDTPIGKPQWCNSFPVGSCEWLITGHQFQPGKTYQVKYATHPGVGIKRFTTLINESNMRPVFGADAVIVDLPDGGDTYDFTKYMAPTPEATALKKGDKVMVYHVHESILTDPSVYVPPSAYKIVTEVTKVGKISVTGIGEYQGFEYKAENHNGMCGSMVFTAGRNPVLVGMHAAGKVGTERSGAVLLGLSSIEETKPKNYVKLAETSDRRSEIYDKDITTNPEVHSFNPIHSLDAKKDFNMEVHGQHKLPRSRFSSDVKSSIIQEPLIKAGLELKDTAPPKSAVQPTRLRHLSHCAEELPPINPRYMNLAKEDFLKKLDEVVFKDGSSFQEFVHPLTFEDALNGVADVRGIDPVNPNTSMSFPLTGPKWKYFVQCDALKEQFGLQTKRYVTKEVDRATGDVLFHYELKFDPEKADVIAETEHNLSLYSKGERANVVFRTHCKDAPVSFEKAAAGNIRIISGAPVDMVITSRMLTLTLINAMTYFPTEFESAVGINGAGKDWQYIADYLQSMSGGTRCGDGDHKKYDQRVRPTVSKPGYECLKHMLVKCGMPDDLLKIFDGFATECMFPFYDIDGLIVKVFGSNPSGHPLTVVMNGIFNSLYMRYAYYSMHAAKIEKPIELGDIPLFHKVIALITYGDDNNFDVSPEEPLFNMMSAAKELARIGLQYTNANKAAHDVPFKSLDELSFLKRNFHVHPELGVRVGALDLESVNRALLLGRGVPKGCPASEAELVAQNMEGALSEAFLHSHAVYNRYKELLAPLVDIRDSEGHRIGDHYKPPSIEALTERYDNTHCCYPDAQYVLGNVVLDCQCGPLDAQVGDVLTNLDVFHANYDELVIYYYTYMCMGDIVDFISPKGENRNLTVTDIKFRKWCIEVNIHAWEWFGWDVRMKDIDEEHTLEFCLYTAFLLRIQKHALRASTVGQIDYMCERIDGRLAAAGPQQMEPPALGIYRRMRRRNVEAAIDLPLPREIQDAIWDFLQPMLWDTPLDVNNNTVYLTPDIYPWYENWQIVSAETSEASGFNRMRREILLHGLNHI